MNARIETPSKDKAGRGVWIGVVAGLAFVVLANAAMITVAVNNPPAHETDDHYGDALRYDEVIEARAASEALGWRVGVTPCADELAACTFVLEVRDRDGVAVEGLGGTVELRRADSEVFDRRAAVTAEVPGRYVADLSLGAGGLYELSIDLKGSAGHFTETRRVIVEE